MRYLTETNLDHSIANFVLYNRKAVAALAVMGDYYKYYPVLNRWIGFRTAKLPVQHAGRKGPVRSSYSLKKRLDLAVTTIVTFSDKPLRLVMRFGISLVAINLVIAFFLTVRHIVYGEKVSGWLSIFLSLWILSGIIIAILGMMGTYMGKMFETVKNRPRYIVKETTAADHRDEK
jgi:dolichol-phosphate mannosyltransferase